VGYLLWVSWNGAKSLPAPSHTGRKRMRLTLFAASCLSVLMIAHAQPADAGWYKVDPLLCEGSVSQYWGTGSTPGPQWGVYPFIALPVTAANSTQHFYCPVPDQVDIPVWNINSVAISGRSGTGSASAARGCIQFSNGSGSTCQSWQPFPEGQFTDWALPVPTALWDEHWHAAYLNVRITGLGSANTYLSKIFYRSP
jgi:hypothetical protein